MARLAAFLISTLSTIDSLRKRGPQRAGDLAGRFPRISRPAVSKHLRVLRGSKLVQQERRGREIWYRLDPLPLSQVEGWLENYRAFWQHHMNELRRLVEKG